MCKDFTWEAVKDDRFWNPGVGTKYRLVNLTNLSVARGMHIPANPEDFGLLALSGFLEEVWVALEHLTDPSLVSLSESRNDRIRKRI